MTALFRNGSFVGEAAGRGETSRRGGVGYFGEKCSLAYRACRSGAVTPQWKGCRKEGASLRKCLNGVRSGVVGAPKNGFGIRYGISGQRFFAMKKEVFPESRAPAGNHDFRFSGIGDVCALTPEKTDLWQGGGPREKSVESTVI